MVYMNPLVSVIVPIYRVERYLEKCINSVLSQSYENIEIILVDDGSPDKCPQICDKYAHNHTNIIVIHKENGGVSSARNFGIKACNGKYITFIDPDDYISPSFIKKLVDAAVEYSADLVISNLIDTYEDGTIKTIPNGIISLTHMDRSSAIEHFIKSDIFASTSCGCLYKKDEVEPLLFDERMRIAEDNDYLYRHIKNSNRIVMIPDKGYHYFIRTGSVMHSNFSEKYYDEMEFCKRLLDEHKNNQTLYLLAARKMFNCYSIMFYFNNLSKKDYSFLRTEFKSFMRETQLELPIKKRVRSKLVLFPVTRMLLIRLNELRKRIH